jgi:hypothetical protein
MRDSRAIYIGRCLLWVCACASGLLLAGCGATKNRVATEQLLISDAVDRAVAHIDFAGLVGQKVYLDTQYIQHIRVQASVNPGPGMVNADYITSSIRQQMMAGGVLVQNKQEEADYVVELRCGAIGSDAHEVLYGLPANNFISSASNFGPGAPVVPAIPEIALAKRNDTFGAAKIGVFAYHRTTKEPIWQAGIAQARSTSKDVWLLGAGPFQRGTIYDAPRFAGSKLKMPLAPREGTRDDGELVSFSSEPEFAKPEDRLPVDPPTPEPLLLPVN